MVVFCVNRTTYFLVYCETLINSARVTDWFVTKIVLDCAYTTLHRFFSRTSTTRRFCAYVKVPLTHRRHATMPPCPGRQTAVRIYNVTEEAKYTRGSKNGPFWEIYNSCRPMWWHRKMFHNQNVQFFSSRVRQIVWMSPHLNILLRKSKETILHWKCQVS